MAAMDAGRATSDRLRAGGVVLAVDDATDPPQASLVCAAARVTPSAVNFLATHGRGLVCLTLTRERMRQLGIPLMTSDLSRGPVFQGASIEARQGVSTGISAADRATTVLAAVARDATPSDLVMPGHVTPIQLTPGGALVRASTSEAASDLAQAATSGCEGGCPRVHRVGEAVEHLAAVVRGRGAPPAERLARGDDRLAGILARRACDVVPLELERPARLGARERAPDEELVGLPDRESPAHSNLR